MDKKEGKKKKRKKSAAEKSLEKLQKQSDDLKNNPTEFKKFVAKVERWLDQHNRKDRALKYFAQADADNEGTISYEEFKAGMLDLNAPCNATEIYTMSKLLDLDEDNRIHFTLLEKGLQIARTHEQTYEKESIRPALPLTYADHTHCVKCKMLEPTMENYWSRYPRYILVELRLAPFAKEDHPGHVTALLPSHVTMAYLEHVIEEETHLVTSKIYILDQPQNFKVLPRERRLEDDYDGGTLDNPTKVTLYYNYRCEFNDCPLLMSDYFIGLKKSKAIAK